MSLFEAIVLGIIQGLTEFFPISSSGHLILAQLLFGMRELDRYIPFDLICHGGTLLSIFCFFLSDIKEIFSKRVIFSILPLFPLYFILKPIREIYNQPKYLGFFFLMTAAILYCGEKWHITHKNKSYRDSFIIGTVQAIAILPGVSRSGSTISCASVLGWEKKEAARFSFLMAVPTILGGMAVEGLGLWRHPQQLLPLPISVYVMGFFFSFLTGLLALFLIMKLAKRGTFKPFVYYCLAIGLFTIYYTHYG